MKLKLSSFCLVPLSDSLIWPHCTALKRIFIFWGCKYTQNALDCHLRLVLNTHECDVMRRGSLDVSVLSSGFFLICFGLVLDESSCLYLSVRVRIFAKSYHASMPLNPNPWFPCSSVPCCFHILSTSCFGDYRDCALSLAVSCLAE